jgi:hypothetical protein
MGDALGQCDPDYFYPAYVGPFGFRAIQQAFWARMDRNSSVRWAGSSPHRSCSAGPHRSWTFICGSHHDQTEANRDRFDDFTTTREVFLTPGTYQSPPVGSVFRNSQMAATYREIANRGVGAFYSGNIASAIVQSVQNPPVVPGTTRNVRPGYMTLADLAAYRAPFRAPAASNYRGYRHVGMGPPSSGASTVGEALNILEGYPLGTMPRPEALHYFLESSAFSFADRGRYVADPDHVDVPLAGLLSDSFAAERRALIGPTAARELGYRIDWQFAGAGTASKHFEVQGDSVFVLDSRNVLMRLDRQRGKPQSSDLFCLAIAPACRQALRAWRDAYEKPEGL